MEINVISEIHRYAHLGLSKDELDIVNYIIDSDTDLKVDIYERNGYYFLFNENDKLSTNSMVDYIEYSIKHPLLKTKIRKEKIEKITKGS